MSGPVHVPVALRWSDMDAYGHINNTDYLRLLEQARVEGLPLHRDPGVTGFLVVRNEIEYLRPLAYRSAPVTVTMWCTSVGGAGFDLGYSIATQGNDPDEAPQLPDQRQSADQQTVHAVAATTLVAYDFPTQRPRRLTADERAELDAIAGPAVSFRRRATTP